MDNLSRYFKHVTHEQFAQAEKEFEDFVADNTETLPVSEIYGSKKYVFIKDKKTKWDDFFMTKTEIEKLISFLKTKKMTSFRIDYYKTAHLWVKSLISGASEIIRTLGKPRQAFATRKVGANQDHTWFCNGVFNTLAIRLQIKKSNLSKLYFEIYKTDDDWFWVILVGPSYDLTYYRCDGFKGLCKLIEYSKDIIDSVVADRN